MPDIEFWKIAVSLGVPGLALGVFYMLFRSFHWDFPRVPQKWVAPIIILFILVTAGVILTALVLWAPSQPPPTNGATNDALLPPIVDRTPLHHSTDSANEIPGVAVRQVLEGGTLDASSKVYEVVVVNESSVAVMLRTLGVNWRYRTGGEPGSVRDLTHNEPLVSLSANVIEFAIDAVDQTRGDRNLIVDPPIVVPPRDQAELGRCKLRVQLHYTLTNGRKYHPHLDWNIYFVLFAIDEVGRKLTIFPECKWREPDSFRT